MITSNVSATSLQYAKLLKRVLNLVASSSVLVHPIPTSGPPARMTDERPLNLVQLVAEFNYCLEHWTNVNVVSVVWNLSHNMVTEN